MKVRWRTDSAGHDDGVKAHDRDPPCSRRSSSASNLHSRAQLRRSQRHHRELTVVRLAIGRGETVSLDYVKALLGPLHTVTGPSSFATASRTAPPSARSSVLVSRWPGAVALHYVRKTPDLVDANQDPFLFARQLSPDGKAVVSRDAYLPIKPSATKTNTPVSHCSSPISRPESDRSNRPWCTTDSVDPAWSPDGEVIAFARTPVGAPRFGDDGVGSSALTLGIVPPHRTRTKRLQLRFRWTADGAGVAFGVGGVGLITSITASSTSAQSSFRTRRLSLNRSRPARGARDACLRGCLHGTSSDGRSCSVR